MFKLNIECSKDINELHINFSDGTCVTTSGNVGNSPTPQETNCGISESSEGTRERSRGVDRSRRTREPKAPRQDALDVDANFGGVSQEVIELPIIETSERSIRVASELQNLDI